MAITVTSKDISIFPVANYVYLVTGLTTGSNTINLPTPPAVGSFPVAGDWTPTVILCFPYQAGAVGNTVTPDLSSITNSSGAVSFTLYASGATNCLIIVM